VYRAKHAVTVRQQLTPERVGLTQKVLVGGILDSGHDP
jgi:hypothetical protein